VAKLVADWAAREGFPQTGRESASSLKPSRNDYLRPRGTVKETGGGPLQTSALPVGYGARSRIGQVLDRRKRREDRRLILFPVAAPRRG